MLYPAMLTALTSACLVTLFLTPLIRSLALRFGVVDHPSERKVHTIPRPLLGGVAVISGIMLATLLVGWVFSPDYLSMPIVGIIAGTVIVMLVGIIDDVWDLRPTVKFVFQIVAALVPIAFGLRIEFGSLPFGGMWATKLALITVPITVVWIVGITNAINLIDGLDGLATGITLISASVLALFSFTNGALPVTTMALAIIGACAAFLAYNIRPASIFLGDAGSLPLGYLLGTLSVLGVSKGATLVSVSVPIFMLGVPIVDTLAVMIQRFLAHRSIFTADRRHIHHRLMDAGLPYDNVVYLVYALSALSGLFAIILGRVPLIYYMIALGIVVILIIGLTGLRRDALVPLEARLAHSQVAAGADAKKLH